MGTGYVYGDWRLDCLEAYNKCRLQGVRAFRLTAFYFKAPPGKLHKEVYVYHSEQ